MPVEAWELTPDDRSRIDRLLSSPLDFPDEFKKYILDYGAMHIPPIPIDQLQGYRPTRVSAAEVATQEGESGTSYVELATEGPVLSGLADGTYLAIYGCWVSGTYGHMTVMGNPVSPPSSGSGDPHSVYIETGGAVEYQGARLNEFRLKNGDNNELRSFYRRDSSGAGTAYFEKRFLVAIRIA